MSWMPVLSTRHAGWVDTRASKTRQARFALVDVVATIDIESRLAPGMATKQATATATTTARAAIGNHNVRAVCISLLPFCLRAVAARLPFFAINLDNAEWINRRERAVVSGQTD